MWVCFYTASEEKGIYFRAVDTSIWGDVFRVKLTNKGPWYWVRWLKNGDFRIGGRDWTDFSAQVARPDYGPGYQEIKPRRVVKMANFTSQDD